MKTSKKLLLGSCILLVGVFMLTALCFNSGVFSSPTVVPEGTTAYSVGNDGEGTGTENDPYLIGSAAVLNSAAMRTNFGISGKYFKLINDINLVGLNWIPIPTFINCVLDGNGKTISNLNINRTGDNGLFGKVIGGTIKNFTLSNVNITGGQYVGSIAGSITGTIVCTNVYVEGGSITNTTNRTGGLFGQLTGRSTTNNIDTNLNLTIDKCYVDSFTMTSVGNSSGGLVGLYESGTSSGNSVTITNSYHIGNITGNSNIVAGIMAGFSSASATVLIENCFNKGDLKTASNFYIAGGIFGYANTTSKITITNCYSVGAIVSSSNASFSGGIYSGTNGGSPTININNSYYNSNLYTGQINGSSTGTVTKDAASGGKTTAEMQTQAFVTSLNNGTNTWAFATGEYPSLIALSKHIIEFDLTGAGGASIRVSQPKQGNYVFPEEQPVWAGNTFLGWWTEAVGGTQITTNDSVDIAITKLYAHWTPTIYYFNFTVTLYDEEGVEIDDAQKINELISRTNAPQLSGSDKVNNSTNGIFNKAVKESGYKFSHFEINENPVDLNNFAEDFKDYGTVVGNTTNIVIKAIYVKQFTISFKDINNTNLQGNASVIIKSYDKDGNVEDTYRKFFDEKYYDRGTTFSIVVSPASGWGFEINAGNFDSSTSIFTLEENVNIGITMTQNTNAISLELQSNIDGLLPFRRANSQNMFAGSEINAGEVLTNLNSDYVLRGWEVYINGNTSPLAYTFSVDDLDAHLNILDLNIADIISAAQSSGIADVTTITLKAIWQRNVGIEIIYINGSKSEMGRVDIYKNDQKVTDLKNIANGDILEFRLVANPHYQYINGYVNGNAFEAGKKTITVDGIMEVKIEFKPLDYNVTNVNTKADLVENKVAIGDNIIVNLVVGFGSEISSSTVKIDGKPVDAKYIKAQGNSLIISVDAAFLDEYSKDQGINLDIDYLTKMNGLLIGIIGGSGALIIAAAILITLYMLALKKRKTQLQKAEEQHKVGMARLGASDTIKNLRDEG